VTGGSLAPAAVPEQMPELLRDRGVVALVPATGFKDWAAAMAWRVARAAAGADRRTALVDCFVDEPTLHRVIGLPNEEGLVDAFEYGASLARVALKQPEPNLFFIPAGTYAPDPRVIMTHPRWKRLAAGFRHEGALLLLYLPPRCLPLLASDLDAALVLAPEGIKAAAKRASEIRLAEAGGLELVALGAESGELREELGDRLDAETRTEPEVVAAARGDEEEAAVEPAETAGAIAERAATEAEVVAAAPEGDEARAPAEPERAPLRVATRRRASAPMSLLIERRRTSPTTWIVVGVVIAGLGAGGYLYRDELIRAAGLRRATPDTAASAVSAADSAPAAPAAPAPPPLPAATGLPYAVQVYSATRLRDALVRADSVGGLGNPVIIAPVRLRSRRNVFRVYVGPLVTREAGDSALAELRAGGIVGPRAGQVDSVPLSFALVGGLGADSAATEQARLRRTGIPTFILGEDGGTFRLYTGAYASTTAAQFGRALLTPYGGAPLAPRVGYVP
jgi:hypothetical protein